MNLSNIVADDRYRLYQDFMGDGFSSPLESNRLQDYLELVRQTSLALLEISGNAFVVKE